MKTILLILTLFFCGEASAQQKSVLITEAFESELPIATPQQYPGGMDAIRKYFKEEIKRGYKQPCVVGTVYVGFVIKKDGSPTDIMIVRGMEEICDDCNDEAIRLVENMKNWEPMVIDDQSVESRIILPVRFE